MDDSLFCGRSRELGNSEIPVVYFKSEISNTKQTKTTFKIQRLKTCCGDGFWGW
jgi:hypothetical protein